MNTDNTPWRQKYNSTSGPPSTQHRLPNFVSPPDDKYLCVYCKNILRPPVKQTTCGHRLCGACVPLLFNDDSQPLCPGDEDCDVLKHDEIHPDVATTKELQRMLVHCPFENNGCKTTPKWSALEEHAENCDFATALCSNDGCGAMVLRAELKQHEQHECEYLPILCERCDEYVPRKEFKNGHEMRCTPKPRKCDYNEVGCSFEGTSETLKEHNQESSEKHARQLVQATTNVSHDNQQLKAQINELVTQLQDLSVHIDSNQSHSDQSHLHGLQSSIAKLSDEIAGIKGTLVDKADQEMVHKCSTKLAELQQTASMQESRITYLEQASGAGATSDQVTQKVSQLENSVSVFDIRFAEYDVRFRLLETAGYDGRLIWKITSYERRKKDALDGRTLSLYSQPFYTSYYGYKMCARAYLNGDGMGRNTHLSLFFVVMRGEYDALLAWPFRQKVTLALLDQSGNRRHIKDSFRPDPTSTSFRRPAGEMNIASGSPMFAAQSTVESDLYLKGDTIFISVNVDTSDLPEVFP